MKSLTVKKTSLVICSLLVTAQVAADMTRAVTKEDVIDTIKSPGYSPYAGRNFPTMPLWGDTHLHTSNSLDARAFGVTIDPEMAFRFARGEEVTASHGDPVKLLSLIHISEPTRPPVASRMPSSA